MAHSPVVVPPPLRPLDRIAFAGPMCSGKTFLAEILAQNYGFKIFRFAGKLKEIVADLYGPVTKDNEGRRMLQELADDLKKWDPMLFTNSLKRDITKHILYSGIGNALVTVDDLRFKHEFDALKEMGFTVIGVHASEDVRMKRISKLYPDTDPARFTHPSETEWQQMPMDYWINNDGYGGIESIRDLMAYYSSHRPEREPLRVALAEA